MKIIKKTKYQYGVNTLVSRNGKYYLLSSMKMLDGRTTYNLYLSNAEGWDMEMLVEDYGYGYRELLEEIKGGKYD